MDLKPHLSVLLPKAIQWAQDQEEIILATGRKLARDEIAIARIVGVSHPEKIRLKSVPSIPAPQDFLLAQIAALVGINWQTFGGLTLFYGIFVREERYDRKFLAHECRHVYQFEQRGSTFRFLKEYFSEALTVGYENSAFEKEAIDAAERYELSRL